MAMLLGPRARVLETLLALLLMATATGAAVTNKVYGSKCSSSLECGSSAPFCQIYLTDRSMLIAQSKKQKKSSADDYLNVKPTAHGFCTECKSDCDCGVGEFCAVDTEGEGISVGKHAKLSAPVDASSDATAAPRPSIARWARDACVLLLRFPSAAAQRDAGSGGDGGLCGGGRW